MDVVTTEPDGSPPAERPIDRLCAANGEPVKPTRQSIRAISLDDEMKVIRLDREMNQAEACPSRRTQSPNHVSEQPI
jgi:hypothetical protein